MKLQIALSLNVLALIATAAAGARDADLIYKQPNAPIEDRVRDLLSRMTLEEKVAQLQAQATLPAASPGTKTTAMGIIKNGKVDEAVAKRILSNGIGAFTLIAFGPLTASDGTAQQNALQAWVLKNTRLGIPLLFQAEALHGAVVEGATSFPQAIALGSTWNPALLRQMFTVVAKESRAAGKAQVLAPVFDLARDPRFGRVEEMYSEDPFLVGEMGLAAVQGLQGDGPAIDQDHVIATAKHFIHGQPENGTNKGPSDFSERTTRQTFLAPFEKAVKIGRIGAIMPSYNETAGGLPSHSNPWLLKDVLRGEWGFKGLTVSDWGGVLQLHEKDAIANTYDAAGALAFNAGVDMELPMPTSFPALVDAVKAGKVSQSDIDAAVARVLRAKFTAGLFEHPFTDVKRTAAVLGEKSHAVLARQVADEAMVLLKNEGGLLPLDPAKIANLAVIGPNADRARLGTYSGTPPYYVTVLDGIRKRVGDKTKVSYAEGVRIVEADKSSKYNPMLALLPYQASSAESDAQLIAQAVETAKSADVVVLVLGGNESVSREALGEVFGNGKSNLGDTDTLELPERQNELIREVLKLSKPTIAVLLNGRPYSVEQLSTLVPAILEGWYLGQETGNAIAGVLFGDVNPSGRLPVTIARNVGQLPVYYYRTPSARLGYVFNSNQPLYPFGYGLSYTTFSYGKPTLNQSRIGRNGATKVSVTITNTGKRAGDEVVQMYLHPRYSSVVQPVARLVDFQRVRLQAGETKSVSFDLGPEQLAIWDRDMKHTVEPGTVDVMIGANVTQTESVQLQVTEE